MDIEKLLFEGNILIKNQELILLPDGIFMWKKIVAFLEEKLNKIGYQEVYVDNLLEYVGSVPYSPCEYFVLKNEKEQIKLISYGKYLNEIEEARNTTIDLLEIYNLLGRELLAIPFLMGKLPLEPDKNILTTYYGNVDAESSYLGKKGDFYFNSSQINTGILSTLLNIHRDEKGLVIPPKIAPYQIAIIPLKQNEKGVLKGCKEICDFLMKAGYRVLYNDSNKISSNEKRNYCLKVGVPLIIEIGPRDLERNVIEIIARDNLDKFEIKRDADLKNQIDFILNKIQKRMYNKVLINTLKSEINISNKDETLIKGKISKISWCGSPKCLENDRNSTKFISFNQQQKDEKCLFCAKKTKYIISIIKN